MKNLFEKSRICPGQTTEMFIAPFRKKAPKSLNKQVLGSILIIICFLTIAPIGLLLLTGFQTIQYDKIITNVSRANDFSQTVAVKIPDEIWKIVAGQQYFYSGNQILYIHQVREGIKEIQRTGGEAVELLAVASRALDTLENYVLLLGDQIRRGASVSENEVILEEVRGVASLIEELLQEYIVEEIKSSSEANERLKHLTNIMTISLLIFFLAAVVFAFIVRRTLSNNIQHAISKVEDFSNQIAAGQLDRRITSPSIQEFEHLTGNLNIMATKIQQLIDANIREQKNLQKAQMQALQAQITPHFLYNTLDTIIWLAEVGQTKQVVELTKAFSNFFRISLSRGREWITVGEEIEHIKSYLTVQEIRYRDILDYEINCDESLYNFPMLKLVLQPLVENALYHGIKNRRGRGHLQVNATRSGDLLHFEVTDNGIGMTEERLAQVTKELSTDFDRAETTEKPSVYGLFNVNKRLYLYYNQQASLNIVSVLKQGTTVSFNVPLSGPKEGKLENV